MNKAVKNDSLEFNSIEDILHAHQIMLNKLRETTIKLNNEIKELKNSNYELSDRISKLD